jgi:hypothetical protein
MEVPDDLNASIVERLPPHKLRKSCNGIFQDEMRNISGRLRDATKAMERLMEVEAAVSRLQQGKSDRGRSKNLMALMMETESVTSALSKRLELMERALSSMGGDSSRPVTHEAVGTAAPSCSASDNGHSRDAMT